MDRSGNTPDPEFTQAELDAKAIHEEIAGLKQDLKNALVWQFRMISAIWEIGKTKGLWQNSDVTDATLKQKYADWQTKLDRLAQNEVLEQISQLNTRVAVFEAQIKK